MVPQEKSFEFHFALFTTIFELLITASRRETEILVILTSFGNLRGYGLLLLELTVACPLPVLSNVNSGRIFLNLNMPRSLLFSVS